MTNPRNSSTGGFTLLEVLVVIFVLAIVAAVAVPMAAGTSDMQVISAARMISADVQYAQDTAITTQQPVTVTFDPSGESYTLSNASGSLVHPITKEAYVVNFRTTRGFQDMNIVSASFNGNAWVTFDELGSPNAQGSVALLAKAHGYVVSVAAATGKVTVTRTTP